MGRKWLCPRTLNKERGHLLILSTSLTMASRFGSGWASVVTMLAPSFPTGTRQGSQLFSIPMKPLGCIATQLQLQLQLPIKEGKELLNHHLEAGKNGMGEGGGGKQVKGAARQDAGNLGRVYFASRRLTGVALIHKASACSLGVCLDPGLLLKIQVEAVPRRATVSLLKEGPGYCDSRRPVVSQLNYGHELYGGLSLTAIQTWLAAGSEGHHSSYADQHVARLPRSYKDAGH